MLKQDSSKDALQGPVEGSSKGDNHVLHLETGPLEDASQGLTKVW